MTRDMDLVRDLLMQVEAAGHRGLNTLSSEVHDIPEIIYHARLLIDAGFIDGTLHPAFGGQAHIDIKGLTWAGHDFLDSIKNETVWNRTKKIVADKGGGAAVDIIKAIALKVAAGHFGLNA